MSTSAATEQIMFDEMMRCRKRGKHSPHESNYTRLFGTPERAAQTLANVCQFTHGGELCDRCQCYLFGDCDRTLRLRSDRSIYDALLEWLKGEDEVIDEADTIRNELMDSELLRGDA